MKSNIKGKRLSISRFFLGSGEGNNIITGGEGDRDRFWLVTDTLDLPSQENTITDFAPTEDVIGFANLVFGAGGNDSVYGDDGDDSVNGGSGNDSVFGGEGSDTLTGITTLSPQPGLGEVDVLTGNEGDDVFVLGQVLPTGAQSVFYDDGDYTTPGTSDYALITDFGIEGDGDKIQLVGQAGDYSLGASPDNLSSGTAIFVNDGASPELIAIVVGVSPDTLNLDNPNQFVFEI
jgi:Ca2+-binding RTX toxin-like protein